MDNMAYAVWGIFMKKYTKVRRGLINRALPLNSKEDALGKDYDSSSSDSPTESWHTASEEPPSPTSIASDKYNDKKKSKNNGKGKKMKNYLKRCKATANQFMQQHQQLKQQRRQTPSLSLSSYESSNDRTLCSPEEVGNVCRTTRSPLLQPTVSHTSWYVSDEFYGEEVPTSHVTVRHILDSAKNSVQPLECDATADVHTPVVESRVETSVQCDVYDVTPTAENPFLRLHYSNNNRNRSLASSAEDLLDYEFSSSVESANFPKEQRIDVGVLVDRYFGRYYRNYAKTRRILVRQARDVLVCRYYGDLVRFQHEFCVPVSDLLDDIYKRSKIHVGSVVASRGWPLSTGQNGIVLHLTDLEPALLRNGDCYLCVRFIQSNTCVDSSSSSGCCSLSPSDKPNLILNWRANDQIFGKVVPIGFDSPLEIMAGTVISRDDDDTVTTTTTTTTTNNNNNHHHHHDHNNDINNSGPITTSASRTGWISKESTGGASLDLSTILKKLIVTIDRAIERVPLEDLSFPCPTCLGTPIEEVLSLKCQCVMADDSGYDDMAIGGSNGATIKNSLLLRCDNSSMTTMTTAVEKRDTSIQTSPMFEIDTVFPHIDSDEDFDFMAGGSRTRNLVKNGGSCSDVATQCNRKRSEKNRETDELNKGSLIICPTTINDLQEKLLMSGITFPGIIDKFGRSIIVYDTDTVTRSEMIATDIAAVLYYYSSISVRMGRIENNISILTVSPGSLEDIDLLDKALSLITPRVRIDCVLVVWKKNDYHRIRHFKSNHPRFSSLQNSKIQSRVLTESDSLEEYIEWSQIPSEVGGESTHNQLEWVQFYKEVEPFMTKCHSCGRKLVSVMSKLKNESIPLYSQQYLINWVLNDADLKRLRSTGDATLAEIEERAQWLPNSPDVRISVERCERLFAEVQRAAKRLTQLSEKRRDKIQEMMRVKALEQETTEVISWLTNNGEDELKQHSDLANNLPDIRQQEQNFEKFYYISMRNLDKAGDLLEEAGQCSGGTSLKDLARSLKQHLRGFSDRLEDTRERLEDTSRCFYLLDRAYEWALDSMKYMSRIKPEDVQNPGQSIRQLRQYLMGHPSPTTEHFNEMLHLAQKLDNEKLLDQCRIAQCRCEETVENIRSMIGSEVPAWINTSTPLGRRRSVPAHQSQHQLSDQSYSCWDQSDCQSPLDNIPEEFYCANNNGVNRAPNPLQRSCTWQYQTENYDDDDKLSSSADNTTEGSEAGTKSSSEDVDEVNETSCNERNVTIAPVPVNSHLHRNDSLHLNTNCGPQTLKKQKTAKLIMREMVQTERDYVKALEYVIENYIPELIREDIPQALRGQRNVIFGNIEKIYEFHSQNFLHELEQCEHMPFVVGQSFLKYEKKFYLYALYNKNKPKSDSLMAEYGTSFFKGKQLTLGDKMDLASYLLKPVQRMGKYALLLQQLMKVAKTDISELREAEEMVRFQLRHGNDLLAMDSLKECDVNLKEQGRLLRQSEFLVWQGKGKKCFRHVFLFEELILFSKARRFPDRKNLDLYIYKNSIKTSDIGMTAKIGDSNTKFEIWYRKRKPCDTFTLQSQSEDIKQVWTEELSNLLWKQAMKNREIRMAEMSSMGIGNKPCLDIRPSADQINDRSISIAQLCKTAPRFRNSIAGSTLDSIRKRPHSVISVSSNSSSSGASSSSNGGGGNKPITTATSHCSSAESGIVTDWNTNTMSTNSSVVSDSNSPSHQLSVKL